MRTPLVETLALRVTRIRALHLSRAAILRLTALTAIVVLAAALRFSNLAALGYANHYYTAAIKAMLQSWHNFFFVAAEPGGSVTVDKPPVGFWLQAISAYFFGVNGFAVVLPQIIAGIASVIVVYHLVRRWFGTAAGLLAALALAITPIVIATDRNNTIDSTLILTLLLAAWAFIKATESGKFYYLLLGAALVGIGFNIKMLQAYLPLPAFYGLYLLGSKERLPRKVGKLAVASALLLSVSLSWAVAVDLTPADQRPYVGSSGNNSELSLITGYNGIQRLLGMARGFGAAGSSNRDVGSRDGYLNSGSQNNAQVPQPDGASAAPQGGVDGAFAQQGGLPQDGQQAFGGNPGGNGGFMGTGQPGVFRLFTAPLSKEISWLLPFGLFGVVLLLFRSKLHWPLARQHQAVVLWGGWLLTTVVFFSIAGFFHQYYLSMLAPPLAALVGIGIVELWRLGEKRRWLAMALLLVAAGGTIALQMVTVRTFAGPAWLLPAALGLFAAGAVLALIATGWRLRPGRLVSFALVTAALLLVPGVWSGLTTAYASGNATLPAAYGQETGQAGRNWGPAALQGGDWDRAAMPDGNGTPPEMPGGNAGLPGMMGGTGLSVNQTLLDYLQVHTQGIEFLMAVPSSQQGTDYVLTTGRPVFYLGGFSGQDEVVTPEQLAKLVAEGKLRYVLWGGGMGGDRGGQSSIGEWITTHGKVVTDVGIGTSTGETQSGATDDTRTRDDGFQDGRDRGGMQGTLYDLAAS